MSKKHDRLGRINVLNNELRIADRKASELVNIAGGTPLYVYSRTELSDRVKVLRTAMPEALKLHYAIKANPMPAVVQHMSTMLDGLDVASHKEMLVALGTGISPEMISFAGPAKQPGELRAAAAAGIVLNVESVLELERLYAIGEELGIRPNVAFRVNPDFELKSSGMKMAGGPKQFGIDAELMPDILAGLDTAKINFKGFHIFSGSQNLKADALIEAHDKTFELAARLTDLAPAKVEHVNIGGGLGIPYFPGEKTLDVTPVAENLQRLLDSREGDFRNTEIVMELGRYFVGEAGYYLCKVTDKKVSRGQAYLMTDGGLHHNLSNSGNFGQVIRKNYPVLIANRVDGDKKEKVEIVGPLCTPLDIVGAKLELPEAQVEDFIVVFQSGAYGATASPQDFLSHPHVRELLI
ncbi:pyridoxal-dependent decarboxylase, exosortase A system-associated [Endozoicomonas euniceicola]|uniref:Pyridoxal-dependent decarboxylase, exosortase A system-associated n=1 Tax=Endozoicomonas euniceicola TaxID=1234143 RepID=A0ABY6GYW3_9GAMM|nr:pyridoxal-dependent decarboxylase, exosortase A system-associated [Endozoicomonas euniceicola]UYM17984.1 pyridoxal-dependent decarboxylase, exosortase A system-associated [Endozoicomonas euniceicola]